MAHSIHFVVNARMPHIRAYGIQIAKMCEALVEAGMKVVLVVPRTQYSMQSLRERNGLRVDIDTRIVPNVDLYDRGRIGFAVSTMIFIMMSAIFLLTEKLRGRLRVIYTIDMDTFSYFFLPLFGVPCVIEIHGAKHRSLANDFFFKRVALVIATNSEIKDALITTFGIAPEKIIVEANGVDLEQFKDPRSKADARRELGLPEGKKIALYVGRFYPWKGLEILIDAAKHCTSHEWYVIGGTLENFQSVTHATDIPANLHIAGDKTTDIVPMWLTAADALIVLGTQKNDASYRFTTPMKMYEYMAAERPIVASHTKALESMAGPDEVVFYQPDDAIDLAQKVEHATSGGATIERMIAQALISAREHSWERRAQRVRDRLVSL